MTTNHPTDDKTSIPREAINDDDATYILQQRNEAYSRAVPRPHLQGLYTSFQAAATILRVAHALGELDASVIDDTNDNNKEQVLLDFMNRINQVECELLLASPITTNDTKEQPPPYHPGVSPTTTKNQQQPLQAYIIAVEGLDGSGKSSLVESLATALQSDTIRTMTWASPTASMAPVRPVFDKRGGPVSRAFYMVSNYMLDYEFQQLLLQQQQQQQRQSTKTGTLIVMVDRWYTSTVAYSVAWKNTEGGAEAIDALDDSIFQWPRDLRQPDLLIVLQVDDATRRARVHYRRQQQHVSTAASQEEETKLSTSKNKFNPWDDRLDEDASLGQRIMRAFERVAQGLSQPTLSSVSRQHGPQKHATTINTKSIYLNANQSQQQVLDDALAACREHLLVDNNESTTCQIQDPLAYFDTKPLEWFTRVLSSGLQPQYHATAERCLQIAWNHGSLPDAPPRLKTVGIHTVDAAGLLFFIMRDASLSFHSNNSTRLINASILWVGGDDPYQQQQWRAEGFLVPVGLDECEFMDTRPSPPLVAYTMACHQMEMNVPFTFAYNHAVLKDQTKMAKDLPSLEQQEQALQGLRFVPLRMEVWTGGQLSAPDNNGGGPQRLEWTRGMPTATTNTAVYYDPNSGWSRVHPIAPYRGPSLVNQSYYDYAARHQFLRPMTVAITGSHCAGKETLGRLLAKTLTGWSFQPELGAILRNQQDLKPGGHRIGDGSGESNAETWDDQVYNAEVARDQESARNISGDNYSCHRVVETWHVGNLAWALLRLDNDSKNDKDNDKTANKANDRASRESKFYERAKSAIQKEMTAHGRCVLAIHLSLCPEDMIRRRNNDRIIASRVPVTNEMEECTEMHHALDVRAQEYLQRLQREVGLPVLVIDNSKDNDLKGVGQKIVQLINEQQWRRAF